METALVQQNSIPALSIGPFVASRIGLVVTKEDVPFEVWEAYGKALERVEGAIQWVRGDWLNFGERRYGEHYPQAIQEEWEAEYDTLASYAWVAGKIEFCRRRQNLTWSHHKEVAALTEEEQERWLDKAEADGLSVHRLRSAIKMAVHYSSDRLDWGTPQSFFDQLDAEFRFTLDVCATKETAKCEQFFSPEDDGLAQDWIGCCWMNPPYGDEIVDWMAKAYEESRNGATVVCLIPSRTDTAWWHEYAMRAKEIRFVRGRLRFEGASESAPFPSAVVVLQRGFCGPPHVRSMRQNESGFVGGGL